MEARHSELLSAAEAAARLGVKRETLYAYVSRGLLERAATSVGRQSRFAAADVDRLLAERGGRRATPARPAPGLEVTIASAVTTITGDRVLYRGHDLADLVDVADVGDVADPAPPGADGSAAPRPARPRRTSPGRVSPGGAGAPAVPFEAVAELLWSGQLPAEQPCWSAPPQLVMATRRVVDALPTSAHPADRLRVATAAAATADPMRVDLRPPAVRATARGLLVVLAEALRLPTPDAPLAHAPRGPGAAPVPSSEAAHLPSSVAARAAAALGADEAFVGAFDTALVVLADHELATSTLAARVAASTRADPYQVVLAGLAAVSGPYHGSASARVGRLLRAADRPGGPEQAVAEELRERGSVPGFGQSHYPTGDPRAPLLLDAVRAVPAEGARRASDLAGAVAAAVAQRAAIAPNVDFALATLVLAAGLAPDVGEALFALARVAGWVAHGLEEYEAPPLRYRVRAATPGAAAPTPPGDR